MHLVDKIPRFMIIQNPAGVKGVFGWSILRRESNFQEKKKAWLLLLPPVAREKCMVVIVFYQAF